jgi:hypothetical protein
VSLTTAAELVFAVAAACAGIAIVGAILGRIPQRLLTAVAVSLALLAIAEWAGFAFRRDVALGVCAGGTTLAALAGVGGSRLRLLVARLRAVDEIVAAAVAELAAVVERESAQRAGELERTLTRARADSSSLLTEQERRLADDRRREAAQHEASAAAALAEALVATQRQVDDRLRTWSEDLDRQQRAVTAQLAQLAQRQKQLISDAEMRIASDAERLEGESEQQREGLMRLRDELARAIQETVSTGNSELETYAAERRRALHELNDRIRRRERALRDQVDREEAEAKARIQAGFADVERRQVEQLQRLLDRATASYSEAAGQQFADAIRSSREEAATRLTRELDRAVQTFAREAERVLAERMAQVGDAGALRLEKRLSQIAAGLERQRAEAMSEFEQRLTGGEHELRRRMDALIADAEADRAVLEARLHELARRVDEAIARA